MTSAASAYRRLVPKKPVPDEDLAILRGYLERLDASEDEIDRAAAVSGLGSLALDVAIRPDGGAESFAKFAQWTGLSEGDVRRQWMALGLPLDPPFPFPVRFINLP